MFLFQSQFIKCTEKRRNPGVLPYVWKQSFSLQNSQKKLPVSSVITFSSFIWLEVLSLLHKQSHQPTASDTSTRSQLCPWSWMDLNIGLGGEEASRRETPARSQDFQITVCLSGRFSKICTCKIIYEEALFGKFDQKQVINPACTSL